MTGKLRTEAGRVPPDELYNLLIEAHRDLDEAASQRLNAKLILLLANHVDDLDVVAEALELARGEAGA